MSWPNIISLLINLIVLAALVFGRKWIEATVENRIKHRFDQRLEETKSELRARETEISALRDMVLSGRGQRQLIVDKRRIEAVERVWAAVGQLAPFILVSASMARINFNEAAKRVPTDAKLRSFFNIIAKPELAAHLERERPVANEQPFIPPLAWALYSAYSSIVMGAYIEARTLAEGVENAGKFLKRDHGRELLKTILPHQSAWIDGNDPSAYHYLLDEVKDLLLAELKNTLDGKDADQDALKHAKQITEAVNKVDEDRAKETVAIAEAKAELPEPGKLIIG